MESAFCPEDRKAEGIFGELSVRENIVLGLQTKQGWLRRLSRAEQERLAREMIEALAIATSDAEKPVGELSGGNQQKVVLARSLVSGPRILILDEPTRGIDVGAHAEVVTLIRSLCARGLALLVASSELDELVAVATGSWFLRDRRKVGEITGAGISRENIMPHHRGRRIMNSSSTVEAAEDDRRRGCGALAGHRAIWPLLALALILVVDGFVSPGFFTIRIVEGRLFGSLIDILYRAMPTAVVALGMAVVIGTKGIDLSVGSVIAICGAVITWRIHAGDPHFVILLIALAARAPVRALERVPGRDPRHPADHRDTDPDGLGARHRTDDQPALWRNRSELHEPVVAEPQRRSCRADPDPLDPGRRDLPRVVGAAPAHGARIVSRSGGRQFAGGGTGGHRAR